MRYQRTTITEVLQFYSEQQFALICPSTGAKMTI